MTDEKDKGAMLCPLKGEWRINNGYLCNGTIRIMRECTDTNPSVVFRDALFDWMVEALNTRATASPQKPGDLEVLKREIRDTIGVSHYAFHEWCNAIDYLAKTGRLNAVPEGYKLVPIEPTHNMIQAGCTRIALPFLTGSHEPIVITASETYKAMLEAAPEAAKNESCAGS